jgi:hypothetical protein
VVTRIATSAIFLKVVKFIVTAGIGLFCMSASRVHVSRVADRILVVVTILAVLLENSGLMKAGPRTLQYEPHEGKVVRFSDVHGVDEAKEVSCHLRPKNPDVSDVHAIRN